jgi:hypothetical protein
MLKIWSSNRVIDTLRMHDGTPNGFVVEPDTAGGSLKVAAITDPSQPPVGLPVWHGLIRLDPHGGQDPALFEPAEQLVRIIHCHELHVVSFALGRATPCLTPRCKA